MPRACWVSIVGILFTALLSVAQEEDVLVQLVQQTEAVKFSDLVVHDSTMTLSLACKEDALRLCKSSAVYDHATVHCMNQHQDALNETCRAWHDARVECQRQMELAHHCPRCSAACRGVASLLRCALNIGAADLQRIVGEGCVETPYFSSIARMADIHFRRRRKIPKQRGFS